MAAALTGAWLTVLSLEDGDWVARGRVDLRGIVETRTREFAASIKAHAEGRVTAWRSGTFGQVGLRDVHLVTHADGTPYEDDGLLMLTMSHAGPGFFDTGHTGVWSFDPATYEIQHRADVWFERDGMVLGDHGSHLVRDGGRWLLATSTWGDFGRRPRTRITLSVTDADLLSGEHVLASEPLPLPEAELPTRCAGTWDPHLAMVDGHWHVAFVAARKYFSFYPALARGARPGELDGFELLGASPGRRATEGTVMARLDGEWRVLASDGRDNPPWCRGGFPVFDLGMRELGTLDAPYLTNIPWPSVVPSGDGWLLLTFDGTRAGGDLAGYGTHGDFVVMRSG